MAAPDAPARLLEVPPPVPDDIADDSRSRTAVSAPPSAPPDAFATLAETFGLDVTPRDDDDDGDPRGLVVAAASDIGTPVAEEHARDAIREGTTTPPVRDTTPRTPEDDSAEDDTDAMDAEVDQINPAFTKPEVVAIVGILGSLDPTKQRDAHDVMLRASGGIDEIPEDLMELSTNALASVDEFLRGTFLFISVRAISYNLRIYRCAHPPDPSRTPRSHRRGRRDECRQGNGRSRRDGEEGPGRDKGEGHGDGDG